MDNNNLNATPVQDVQATVTQAEEVTYSYAADAAEETVEGGGKGLSIASLILGILSVLCCALPCLNFILAVVGLILAIVAKKKNAEGPSLVGLILSIVGIVLALLAIIFYIVYFILAAASYR